MCWAFAVLLAALLVGTIEARPQSAPGNDTEPLTPSTCNFTSYTALGDSYAAGLGALFNGTLPTCNGANGPYCNNGQISSDALFPVSCNRNTGAYSWQLNLAHPFPTYNFPACSGANTTTVMSQIRGLDFGNPDLVTIHIGGNDESAFSTVVLKCVYLFGFGCDDALRNAFDMTSNRLGSNLDGVYSSIQAQNNSLNKTRTVVVLGYPRTWNTAKAAFECPLPFLDSVSQSHKAGMNQFSLDLNAVARQVAQKHGFMYVDTDAFYEGHRLCDAEPWFRYELAAGMSVFHPTEEGQLAFMKGLEGGVGCAA